MALKFQTDFPPPAMLGSTVYLFVFSSKETIMSISGIFTAAPAAASEITHTGN